MSTVDLTKESNRKPVEVVSDVALSDDAVALMQESKNTLAYLQKLCDEELFSDAFLTLARVLPKQYAIIWASRCVAEHCDDAPTPEDQRCVDLVRQWLAGPDEKLRRATMEAADARDYEGPWAWLAAAVGFSGGSLAPENQAEIPPPGHLTAVAVSACLTGIAVANPETTADVGRQMIDGGLAMVAIPSGSQEAN
ncbi:MAG: hypothetical protein OEM51_00195 [Gammaproteobacteria bacterium]|nr:hypothetical protein [Gammaproteobacteria bacterium]MDH3431236.1 hypothetical protein [Gammaproteobacteria bacterium]